MRILITGGAGFIGSHLVEQCLKEGHQVIVLDDFSSGRLPHLESSQGSRRLKIIRGSTRDAKQVNKAAQGCSMVFHLASVVGVGRVLKSPLELIQKNVQGTLNVLEASARVRARVFFASSSEVYGIKTSGKFAEDDLRTLGSPEVGRWSYAITKSLEEAACLAYARERKLKVVVGRLFNVVGTRQSRRYGAVLPRFVEQASSDKPLTVFGSGRQVRSFLHVQDAVRCMQALLRNSRAHGKIVNIGNPGGITVFQLAKRVKYLTRSDSKIIKVDPERQYGPDFVEHPRRVPDLTRLRSLIHFKPSKTLDDAILELASEKEGAAPSAPHKKHWTRRSVSLLKRKS